MNAQKVLFLAHDAGRTGAPILLLDFQRWLKVNSKLEFATVLRRPGPLAPCFAKLGELTVLERDPPLSHSLRLGPARAWRHALAASRLATLRRQGYQLLYSNTVTNGDLIQQLARPGVPVVTHVHELQYWIERSGTANWDQVKRHTTRYVAASQAVASNLRDLHHIPPEVVDVVHESIPGDEAKYREAAANAGKLRATLGIEPGAFVVGGSGAETWRKGKDLFVQLAAMMHRRRSARPCRFVWVGWKGTLDEQRQLTHDAELAGVGGSIYWIGEVTNPCDFFSIFDVFALLSREDPFPLVCLESAMLHKPVLCFAGAGGAPELIEHDAGFVVPYLDLEAMADKLEILAADTELTQRMGASAAEKVRTRYSTHITAPRLLRVIENLIESSGERR